MRSPSEKIQPPTLLVGIGRCGKLLASTLLTQANVPQRACPTARLITIACNVSILSAPWSGTGCVDGLGKLVGLNWAAAARYGHPVSLNDHRPVLSNLYLNNTP